MHGNRTEHIITDIKTDLTRIYQVKAPARPLRSFIHQYYESEPYAQDAQMHPLRLMPHVGFLFFTSFGEPVQLSGGERSYTVDKPVMIPRNHTWLLGPARHCFFIHCKFSFLPYLVLRSQEEFNRDPVPLEEIGAGDFMDSLVSAKCFEERVAAA